MPIALPAPLPPVQGSADLIQAQGAATVTASVKDTQVHVIGPEVVSKERLAATIGAAVDQSDAVRQIQALYYAAGYPAVKVTYALAGSDLYVLVNLGKVDAVEAPAPYDRYLAGAAGAEPFTDAQLEPARTLASLHADRAGQSAVPEFKSDGERTVLRVEPNDRGPGRSSMGASFGNPGNRFVGRHFVDYFARHSFTTSDELKATGRHALTGLNEDDDAESYYEYTAGWSRVTTLGVFGITGRAVGYQQPITLVGFADPVSFDGTIRQGELAWVNVLAADFDRRWTVGAKGDYTRKDFSTTQGSLVVQRQEYGSAELSTDYAQVVRPGDVTTELSAGLAVRSGLGDDETADPVRAADQGYLLVRPTLGARTRFEGPMSISLYLTGQYSDDTVPEQQQWVMGGIGNIEAYLPGVAVGDSGGLARLQWDFPALEISVLRISPRLFAEYGVSQLENPLAGESGKAQHIGDGGVSLVFALGPNLEAAVSYAESFEEKNIDQAVLDNADANAFFRISAQF